MRYSDKNKTTVDFIEIPGKDLKISGGFILYPSQQTFPLYDLAYKSEDSHIYCISIRFYILEKTQKGLAFKSNQHILSSKATYEPIDRLFNHFNDFKTKLRTFYRNIQLILLF